MRQARRSEARPDPSSQVSTPDVPTGHRGNPDEVHGDVHLDIAETDREVVVKVALGWVVHDSIAVRCSGRTLHIEAERYVRPCDTKTQPSGWKQGDLLKREVTLPCDVCSDQASARYRQGVLTVSVPKRPAAAPAAHRPS